jgi:GWxTD domain-containing protein
MLYPEGPSGVWAQCLLALVLIATTAVTLGAWQSETSRQNSSPYLRWMNEEVVYIISNPERAAFQQLSTDDERDKFIEQFWLIRDPTPGTSENEFREEHYRRIAFANERFKPRLDKGGWQTDRGRIYIMYGPPDEIESHPNGDAEHSTPFEKWRYRHIEGIGNLVICTFIDPTRTGDYRMTREDEKVQ